MNDGPTWKISNQRAKGSINQPGRDLNCPKGDMYVSNRDMYISKDTLNPSAAEVIKIIADMRYKINESDIDVKDKKEIGNHLDSAVAELEDKNPNKMSIANSMKQTNEILKEAKTTGETLNDIGKMIYKVAIWLGSYGRNLGLI